MQERGETHTYLTCLFCGRKMWPNRATQLTSTVGKNWAYVELRSKQAQKQMSLCQTRNRPAGFLPPVRHLRNSVRIKFTICVYCVAFLPILFCIRKSVVLFLRCLMDLMLTFICHGILTVLQKNISL